MDPNILIYALNDIKHVEKIYKILVIIDSIIKKINILSITNISGWLLGNHTYVKIPYIIGYFDIYGC